MIIRPIRTSRFTSRHVLARWITRQIPSLSESTIVAVASKIVAVSQKRIVAAGSRQKAKWIQKESVAIGRIGPCWLTLKDGHVCPNAGIDESNANGKLILWPLTPYSVAQEVRALLCQRFHRKQIGVLITDSRIFPLRVGVTGVALGYAGFRGLRDYRGKKDIYGRTLSMTQTNVADALASAAILVMGEGNEQQPLATITEAPVKFCDEVDPRELSMEPTQDLFYPLLAPYLSES